MAARRNNMVGGMSPLFCSFYTPDYTVYAERLIESLDGANINMSDRCVRLVKSQGTWVKNCAMKAEYLWQMLDQYQRPLVWVDADAVVRKYSSFFSTLIGSVIDIAAHMPDRSRHPLCNSKLCSGTLFINNTPAAQDVLMDWITTCTEREHALDQDVLHEVLFDTAHTSARDTQVRFANLPCELCAIFDLMKDIPQESRVIEHFQASRKMRDLVGVPSRAIAHVQLDGRDHANC